MIAIIDYGVGNLFSLQQSLSEIGADSVITSDEKVISSARKLILPGVGAFGDAAMRLNNRNLGNLIKMQCENGKPLLGICLGMQLLFDKSFEYGEHNGLGLIRGNILPLKDYVTELKIPHMGWNSLNISGESPLFKNIKQGDYVYFVHSYFAKYEEECLSATADYGINVTAAVRKENVYGVQFHPEKSGKVGLEILRAFNEIRG